MNRRRTLITGHRGFLGRALVARFEAAGRPFVGFDLEDGQDVRDAASVRSALREGDDVIHLAATVRADADAGDMLRTNAQGTWNVLQAAVQAGSRRFVYASSVNVLGVFQGDGDPDYLPIDDDHPCRPRSPYGLSKYLGELLCRETATTTDLRTSCLRFPAIWDSATYASIANRRREDPSFEWSPYWEYGAFLDIRDAGEACVRALDAEHPGHVTALLCAADISTSGASGCEHARRLLPHVPWRGHTAYAAAPYRALLDTRRARDILGFEPAYTWHAWSAGQDHPERT